MTYRFLLTKSAKDDLLAVDKATQKRIVEKLRFFLVKESQHSKPYKKLRFFIISHDPLKYAKKLKDSRLGTYRFRIGDYRVIFDLDKEGNIHILIILRVRHRRDVYE